MYVIRRNEDGKYVTCPGAEHSYTNKLQWARTFDTLSSAQRDCCGNERVLTLAQAMYAYVGVQS